MSRPAHWFRGDIDGLRAIAILAVVAFHVELPGFGGGFTGVDIFFVISGWLITRNLLDETTQTGRVRLGDFWARRIRRLVPALSLVVALSMIASVLFVPASSRIDLGSQALAAVLYVSNIHFIRQSVDYFAADYSASPFLHTWSLGVEEQFYVIWPIMISAVCLVVALLARRKRSDQTRSRSGIDRRVLLGLFAAVFLVSFVHNLLASRTGTNFAFFSITTRAWEFAAAGMLAALAPPRWLRHETLRQGLAVLGLAIIAVGLIVLRQTPSYPGFAALVPVAGTMLVILAGERFSGELEQPSVSRVLRTRPAQWIGRVSYSWYLWHWPAMVIAVAALPAFKQQMLLRFVMGVASLPIAWLAYRFFETPIRFAPVLSGAPLRTFAAGGALTAILIATTTMVRPPASYATVAANMNASIEDLQAPPGSSMDERLATAVGLYRARAKSACPRDGVEISTGDIVCFNGALNGKQSVMLMGDSHAGQWRRTFHQLGTAHDFKLIVREHDGCPPIPIEIARGPGSEGAAKREVCTRQQEGNLRVIKEVRPDLVVLAYWSHAQAKVLDQHGDRIPKQQVPKEWERQTIKFINEIKALNIPVALIVDAPMMRFNVTECLLRSGPERCTMRLAQMEKHDGPYQRALRRAARTTSTPTLDLPRIVCTDRCRTEIDGVLVYADRHHFTDAYALALTDDVWDLLLRADPQLGSP